MTESATITREQAATAKRKLQEYVNKIDTYYEHEKLVTEQIRSYRTQEAAETRKVATALHDGLIRQAHQISGLLSALNIEGFSELAPQTSRKILQLAIGIYTGIENGAEPPRKPEIAKPLADPSPVIVEREPSWWASPLAVALIGAASGGVAGLGTSFVGAFYGTKQTCIAGDEKDCAPRNGVPHVRLCGLDGRGYGPCKPLPEVMPPTPLAAPAAPTSPPPLPPSGTTP